LSGVSIKTIEKIEAGLSKGSPRTALLLSGPLAVDVELIVRYLVKDYRGGNEDDEGATGETDGDNLSEAIAAEA
jgi:transcriptional regulator with XRE-family HTH domain